MYLTMLFAVNLSVLFQKYSEVPVYWFVIVVVLSLPISSSADYFEIGSDGKLTRSPRVNPCETASYGS